MACRYEINDDFEHSESESGGSSYSQSDDEYSSLPWLDKVDSKGDLFYIERDFSLHANKNFFTVVPNSNELPSKSGPSHLTAADKFKKWMKKRKHKVRKKFLLFKSSKYNENINDEVLLNSLSFTSRDVELEVNTSRQTLGRKITLAGELLGLELGPLEELNNIYMADKIQILGFVSGREIDGVRIGDLLHSINDENVYLNNIDETLLTLDLPSKVKLTFLSPCLEYSGIDCLSSKQSCIVGELLDYFDVIEESKSFFRNVPYGVFFFKTLGELEEESAVNESILYKYPDENTALFLLKGMFITLSHIITEVASSPILSCSSEVKGQTVHVGFLREKDAVLLLAISAEYATEKEVQYFVTNVAKLLKFQFSSLENAFSSGENKSKMDKFFAMFFKHFLYEKFENMSFSSPHLFEILPSAQWLPLPIDLKTEVDEILNELESSDFGSSSRGFYENQRIYTILGSCLFYKGYLLSNHLQKNDFLDLHLFLHYNHILTMTKEHTISELIIWKEIYPSRFQETNCQNSNCEEVQGRNFLLIVAMNYSILSIILESGGCSIVAESHPPPEPFYVEEVQNTLIILHNYGITSAVEKSIKFCLPLLASPDVFLIGDSASRNSQPAVLPTVNNSINTSVRSLQCSSSPSSLICDKGPADGESDIDSDYSNTSNENSPVLGKKSRNSSIPSGSTSESQGSGEYFSHLYQFSSDNSSVSEVTASTTFDNLWRSTFGSTNTVFHYIHIDPVEGIFLAPIDEECCFQHGSVDNAIFVNFHRSCMNIRSIFARSLRNEEILNSNTIAKFGVNSFLCSAYEHGILFSYTSKDKSKQRNSLHFWVTGRLFFTPEPREVYVCYHDSIQQDIVEIAFKLGFGLAL